MGTLELNAGQVHAYVPEDEQDQATKFAPGTRAACTTARVDLLPLGFGGGDTNLYGYGLNDPINTVDRAGTSFSTTSRTRRRGLSTS